MKYTEEQKKIEQEVENMYDLISISKILGISLKSTRNKISVLGIKKTRTFNRNSFYTIEQVLEMKNKDVKSKAIIKYYPLKTIETFYIYESKMNTI